MARVSRQIDALDNIGGTKTLTRYDGGLNTVSSNKILLDNESIIRKNWSNEERGALQKVNGFTVTNDTKLASAPVLGLFRVYQSDGTTKLLAVCNGTLYFSDNDGTDFTAATNGTGLSTGEFNSGVNYNNLFFFTNRTNNIQHYTPGTDTMAAATDQPTNACRVLLKRADRRLLALNNTTNGSTLYYSKIDPTGVAADDWSATNDAGSIAIDGAKSERLVSGMTFGAVDIILKDYAAFRVWGYPNPQAIRMPGSPGCVSPGSVTQGDGLGFFLGHDGVWMWDGNKFYNITDSKIENIIASMNSSKFGNIFGTYRDGKYWLFYTSSSHSTNQDTLIYDVERSNPYQGQNVWFERDGLAMNCPIIFNGTGDNNEIYAGDSASTGFVYRLDFSASGADNTSDITAVNQTKYFDMDTPNLVKRFTKIHFKYFLSKGDLLFNWYTDRGGTTGNFTVSPTQTGVPLGAFTLGTSILAGEVEGSHTEILDDTAVGKDISIKFTHEDTGTAPIVREMEIEYEALYTE